jgi:hypothetical protein
MKAVLLVKGEYYIVDWPRNHSREASRQEYLEWLKKDRCTKHLTWTEFLDLRKQGVDLTAEDDEATLESCPDTRGT